MTRGFGMAKDVFDPWDNPAADGVRLTKATALRSPEPVRIVPSAKDDRRPIQERMDELARLEAVSVGLAQPHRRGSDDKRLHEPFGRFCKAQRLGDHCWLAGMRYEEIVRQARAAQGLHVPGLGLGDGEPPSCQGECHPSYCVKMVAERKCRAAQRELARARLLDADKELRLIMPRAPGALRRLVYDKLEPSPQDTDLLIHCLVRLAEKFGTAPRRAFDRHPTAGME